MIDQPQKGEFLVAMPTLLDPNFRRTVVLLCEHGPEGSMGIVLNRPTEVEVSTLVDEFPILTETGIVYSGGPVAKNAMLILCRGEDADMGHVITEGIFLAKDLEIFKNQQEFLPHWDPRCYLGYAGWAPGQLDNEMKSGSWILASANSGLIFETNPMLLWQEMMRSKGGELSFYASMPADPTLN